MFAELKIIGKQALIYGSGMLLGKAIGFFLIPLYTHYLMPKDYGILELLDTTAYIISYFLGLGLDGALLRYYSIFDDDKDKKTVVSTAFLFQVIIGIVITCILFSFRNFLTLKISGSLIYTSLFSILFINLFLSSLNGLLKVTLRAQQKAMEFTLVSIIHTIVVISLNIIFICNLKLGVTGILFSSTITTTLSLLYLVLRIVKYCGLSIHLPKLNSMLKYGIPLVPAGIFIFILNWSDRYILRIFCDLDTIGLYALGYKIAMIVAFLIAGPFNLIWGAYMFEVEKKENAKEIYARVATYFILVTSGVGLAISVCAREIIVIIANPSYLDAYKVIPLIVLGMIFMTTDNVFQTGILVRRKTMYLPFTVGLAAILNIILNFIFIPRYGMMGAALATTISFFVYSVGIFLFAQKLYYIGFELPRILKIVFAALITYEVSTLISTDNIWLSIIARSFVLCIFPMLLYMGRFLTEAETVFIKQHWRFFYQSVFKNSRSGS